MKVKLKTWNNMEKEYGLNKMDHIDCDALFVQDMEKNMPKDRIIEIHPHDGRYKMKKIHQGDNDWTISKDMIEKVLTIKDHPEYYL